jgi:hypothetical protein
MLVGVLFERPELEERQRNLLKEIYREDVLRLQELVGKDLSGWLE